MKTPKVPNRKAQPRRRPSPDALAIAALALILGFFYWGFLVGRSYIWDDTLTQYYPMVNYFAKSMQAGRFPLWFPGIRDGIPFWSDTQMAMFYPPQWLLIPFVRHGRLPFLVYQRYIALHYLLGGAFMYAFLKRLKLSPVAALGGTFVYCLSAYPSLRIVTSIMIQVYTWLPLQLLFVHRLTSKGSRWNWLGLVATMVVSLLAGHQQTTLYCWYLVVAYWLYRSYGVGRMDGLDARAALRRVAVKTVPKLLGTFLLVFMLSAVMVLPSLENWWHTSRPHQSFVTLADSSLPYNQLLTLEVPNFFGVTRAGSPVAFWGFDPASATVVINNAENGNPGFWQYWEFGAYAGQVFWLALLVVLFNWRSVDDRSAVRFFLAAWVVAIWFMLGRYGGLFQILYHILPGVSLFRTPSRMACVATFTAAVLCASGLDLLGRSKQGLRYWPVFIPATFCAVLAATLSFASALLPEGLRDHGRLNWSQHETVFVLGAAAIGALIVLGVIRARSEWARRLCLGGLLIVSVADFHHAYGNFQRSEVNPDGYYAETDSLLTQLKAYREQIGPYRFGQRDQEGRLTDEVVAPRDLACFHDFLEVPEGYHSYYLDTVANFQAITNEAAKLDIQNVKAYMQQNAQGQLLFGTHPSALPRAKFFARIKRYDTRAALLTALGQGGIDWQNEVAICEPLPAGFPSVTKPGLVTDADDEVQYESITPESYSVTYDVKRPGIIFVSESFYPGWAATDARTKLIEVFGAFQGIVIPEAGHGQVVVRFAPSMLKLGTAITGIGAVIVALLLAFGKWDTSSRSR